MISGVDLVKLILEKAGPVPQKKLQKLAYLMEIEYIKEHGRRLSNLNFKRYYFGPFSDDIRNIEDLDDDIIVTEVKEGTYSVKEARLLSTGQGKIIMDPDLEKELQSSLDKYRSFNGALLENMADNTEPFLETGNLNDPIDLDGYARYQALIGSEKFIGLVRDKDEENQRKGLYKKVSG